MFTAPNARPTGNYENIDNDKRNMYATANLFNGSEGPVNLVWGGDDFGVLEAGETRSLPTFVAEYFARRNLHYKIVSGSEPHVLEAIDKDNQAAAGSEITAASQAEAMAEEARAKRQRQSKNLKAIAESIDEEQQDIEDEPEEEEMTDKPSPKSSAPTTKK